VRVANIYFSGIAQRRQGRLSFADDCTLIETAATTNAGAARGRRPIPGPTATGHVTYASSSSRADSSSAHPRSPFVAVDERGVVASSCSSIDAGKSRTFTTPAGRTMTGGPMQPWTWEIMEVFKVEDGLLHEIEAVLERAPYGMASGWSSWEDGMSDKIQFEGSR
jgi:hypothetical protein